MRAVEFRIWQAGTGLNVREVAEAIGKSPDTISLYRRDGVPERESRIVRLACSAIANDLRPWSPPGAAPK